MRPNPLRALERLRNVYHLRSGPEKLALLRVLQRARLGTAREAVRLHEMLCFLCAYPDDARTLASVQRMLKGFARRADVRAQRDALESSGIAGTAIRYPFFWPSARWLAREWPRHLTLDRLDAAADRAIGKLFCVRSGFAALDRIRPRGLTDAVHFLRLVDAMPGDSFAKESFYDAIEPVLELRSGRHTPSRTLAWYRVGPAFWQREALDRERPDVRAEIGRAPRRVRAVSVGEGARLVDLARAAMVTRSRDLDAFAYGDPRTVRIVEDGAGLAFALIGLVPERRRANSDTWGALTLKNGVPIGYMELGIAGRHVEIAFNTFPAFRDGEAARVFARTLAMLHRVFCTRSFGIDPYQLGRGNPEAIDSGAWWFYYKLGLRPRAAAAKRLARRELARWRADRSYWSSAATLGKLALWPLTYRYH